MLLWFAAIAALGIVGVSRHPAVIAAVDPRYGIALLTGHGWSGIAVLGGVFLAMTGGEAMYADMGHIGRNPIRTSWYGIVLPALLLNYAGQVALFLDNPAVIETASSAMSVRRRISDSGRTSRQAREGRRHAPVVARLR
jgi:KUP system potassium uptake protein